MPADALRLFIGLWPDQASQYALQAWADGLDWPVGARRTKAQDLHLTLHFLGLTAADRVAPLCAALPARQPPIELQLDTIEHWDRGLQVLSTSRPPTALAELHAELAAILRVQGLPVEARPFRPHVTLGRHAAGLHAEAPRLRWRSRALVLAQSLQGYHPLWQAALA